MIVSLSICAFKKQLNDNGNQAEEDSQAGEDNRAGEDSQAGEDNRDEEDSRAGEDNQDEEDNRAGEDSQDAVSYTHLTLPTTLTV